MVKDRPVVVQQNASPAHLGHCAEALDQRLGQRVEAQVSAAKKNPLCLTGAVFDRNNEGNPSCPASFIGRNRVNLAGYIVKGKGYARHPLQGTMKTTGKR